jgi:hypothetical protein
MTYAGSSLLPLRLIFSPLIWRSTSSWWTSATVPSAVLLPHFHVTLLPLRMLMQRP